MPDRNSHDEGKENEVREKRQFIKETIVKPKRTGRQMAAKAAALLFSAVFFGVIAAVTFVVTAPFAKRCLGEDPEVTTSVTIPTDAETLPTETEPVTEAEPETAEEATEALEELVREEIADYQFTGEDLKVLFGNLQDIADMAGKGIVTIHSVKHQTDWFNNPVKTAGQFSGAVIAETPTEYLILTTDSAVMEADSIMVTAPDGDSVSGHLIGRDSVSGMAVIGVNAEDLNPEGEGLTVLELGNSHTVQQGDMLTAVGSPAGYPHSYGYGVVSYIREDVQVTDGCSRIFYVDTPGNSEKGTFLVDMDGMIVGWVTSDYQTDGASRVIPVRAISDYKAILEKLTNGIQVPYIGIQGQEITEAQMETGLPAGIYITKVINDSPAYQEGIQAGDIITAVGGETVATMQEWRTRMDELTVGETVTVTVERFGREEYTELEYQVTIGAR